MCQPKTPRPLPKRCPNGHTMKGDVPDSECPTCKRYKITKELSIEEYRENLAKRHHKVRQAYLIDMLTETLKLDS